MIVAFFDLLEAEGRSLRHNAVRLWYALTLVVITGVLVVMGLALWVWAAYHYVAVQAGPAAGGLFAGFVALCEAGVAIWIIHVLRR